jgi:hypothetical protein
MIMTLQPTNEMIDGMEWECPFCAEILIRYDLRQHHFIWECAAYPDRLRRLHFIDNGGSLTFR